MRDNFVSNIILVLSLISALVVGLPTAKAEECKCITNPYTKKYSSYEKTWYGTKRVWTCEYTCEDSQGYQSTIIGSHSGRYTTDIGSEGVCDGIPFVSTFNAATLREILMPTNPVWFSPSDSSAPEVEKWSKTCRN